MTDAESTPNSISDLLDGYFAAHVLMTCTRLKIYTKCAEEPQPAATLAQRCEVDPGWMALLLDANVALGLLARSDDGYTPAELSAAYLNEQKHGALTNLVKFVAAEEDASWSNLADIIRGRAAGPDYAAQQQADHRKARAYGKSQYSRLLKDAKRCAQFETVSNGIDLGNGLAPIGLVAIQQSPEAHVTVIDWESYETPFNKTVTHAGYRERMTFAGGDPRTSCPQDARADLVCMGNVLSRSSATDRKQLLQAAAGALHADALLHAQEFIDAGTPGSHAALSRLRTAMLFGAECATPLTNESVLDLLADTGFHNVVLLPIPDSPMTCITARRV